MSDSWSGMGPVASKESAKNYIEVAAERWSIENTFLPK